MLEAVSILVPEGAREGVVTLEPWRNPSHQELGLPRNTASTRAFMRLPWRVRGSPHLIPQPSHPPVSCHASHWVNQPETPEQRSPRGAENGSVERGRQMEKPSTWRKEEVRGKETVRKWQIAHQAIFWGKKKRDEGRTAVSSKGVF